jgi:hypothetical protein
MRTHFKERARTSAITAVFGILVSCSTFEESGLPGSAASMARNQIMWVQKEPSTFGHYRLTSLERIYPDLTFFITKHGTPDFLAETDNRGRNYFILMRAEPAPASATPSNSPDPIRSRTRSMKLSKATVPRFRH